MFRRNYCFEGWQDCGREFHFYKMKITKKEAKTHAKYLIARYNLKRVRYFTMGKTNWEERAI